MPPSPPSHVRDREDSIVDNHASRCFIIATQLVAYVHSMSSYHSPHPPPPSAAALAVGGFGYRSLHGHNHHISQCKLAPSTHRRRLATSFLPRRLGLRSLSWPSLRRRGEQLAWRRARAPYTSATLSQSGRHGSAPLRTHPTPALRVRCCRSSGMFAAQWLPTGRPSSSHPKRRWLKPLPLCLNRCTRSLTLEYTV